MGVGTTLVEIHRQNQESAKCYIEQKNEDFRLRRSYDLSQCLNYPVRVKAAMIICKLLSLTIVTKLYL